MTASKQDVQDCIDELRPLALKAARVTAEAIESCEADPKEIEDRWKNLVRDVVEEVNLVSPSSATKVRRWLKLFRVW